MILERDQPREANVHRIFHGLISTSRLLSLLGYLHRVCHAEKMQGFQMFARGHPQMEDHAPESLNMTKRHAR